MTDFVIVWIAGNGNGKDWRRNYSWEVERDRGEEEILKNLILVNRLGFGGFYIWKQLIKRYLCILF